MRGFVSAILILFSLTLSAQTKNQSIRDIFNTDYIIDFFNSIYSMDFNHANKILNEYEDNDFTFYFLKANYHWWMNLTQDQEESRKDSCYKNLDLSLQALNDNTNNLNPVAVQYAKLLVKAIYARIALFNGNYVTSLNQAVHISNEIEASISLAEKNQFHQLPAGIYLYAADWVKINYPLLYPVLWIIPDGNKSLGISYLKKLSDSENILLKTESTYFLMKIYNEGEKDPTSAIPYAKKLIHLFPENFIYRHYYIKLLNEIESNTEMEQQKEFYIQSIKKNSSLEEEQKNYLYRLISPDFNLPK